jgi:A/G-specific adenine glycosylase
MLVVSNPKGEVLLERRPPTGVWGGLWCLPECEPGRDAADWCLQRFGESPRRVEKLPLRRHTFSHFHMDIRPLHMVVQSGSGAVSDGDRIAWYDLEQLDAVGLAAPIARILREIANTQRHDEGEPE